MKRLIATVFFATAILLSGCAVSPENNHVPYISPAQFQTYNCNELLAETDLLQKQADEKTEELKQLTKKRTELLKEIESLKSETKPEKDQ